MEEHLNQIVQLFEELKVNIPKYTSDQALADASIQIMNKVTEQFEALSAQDKTMSAIKEDNKVLLTDLVNICESIKEDTMKDNNSKLSFTRFFIFGTLALVTGVLAVLIILIVRAIQNNLNSFRNALEQISDGKIYVRIK